MLPSPYVRRSKFHVSHTQVGLRLHPSATKKEIIIIIISVIKPQQKGEHVLSNNVFNPSQIRHKNNYYLGYDLHSPALHLQKSNKVVKDWHRLAT